MQDRIEELNASIKKTLEDKAQLESRNADLAKDLQARLVSHKLQVMTSEFGREQALSAKSLVCKAFQHDHL